MIVQYNGGIFPQFYNDILNNHILIAGATGAGKSTLIHNIIKYIHATTPAALVLLDPKRVELVTYKNHATTLFYSNTYSSILKTLKQCNNIMLQRFKTMTKQNAVLSGEIPIYIVIDEIATIFLNIPDIKKPLADLATLGRAAKIFIIAATQRPTKDIITPLVAVNFNCKIALHTVTKRDSVNIIGISGAESLPLYGFGLLQLPGKTIQQIKIDML